MHQPTVAEADQLMAVRALFEAERAELLAWAIGHEKSFKPAKVYHHGGEDGTYVDLDQRNALKLRDLGPIEQVLNDRLMERLPAIMEDILEAWDKAKNRPQFKAEYIVTHAVVDSLAEGARLASQELWGRKAA